MVTQEQERSLVDAICYLISEMYDPTTPLVVDNVVKSLRKLGLTAAADEVEKTAKECSDEADQD